jgi:hypothetical protein
MTYELLSGAECFGSWWLSIDSVFFLMCSIVQQNVGYIVHSVSACFNLFQTAQGWSLAMSCIMGFVSLTGLSHPACTVRSMSKLEVACPRDCGYADGYHGANDFAQGKPPPEDFDFHVLQVQKAMPLACPKIQYIYSYIKNIYTVICCFRLISPLCLMGLTCYCRATSKESLLKRCPWEIASASWTLRNLVPIINVH